MHGKKILKPILKYRSGGRSLPMKIPMPRLIGLVSWLVLRMTVKCVSIYVLETPLAFQEGDILGYFQPKKEQSEPDLYLEKSDRITTYHQMVGGNVNSAVVAIHNTLLIMVQ